MRVGWSLATEGGTEFQENAYFTPYDLTPFDPQAEGFGALTVNLSLRAVTAAASGPVSAEEGRRVYQRYGCIACHATDDKVSRLGPTFSGLYGGSRTFAGGVIRVTADESYLRESILQPGAKVVSGFERTGMGMPSYAGVLTDDEIESVVLFIKGLK
jgi:cytochrome c2